MDPERWRTVKELFYEALDHPTGERRRWLDTATGDDEELLTEVLSLLASHDDAGDFLERPALGRAPAPAIPPESAALEHDKERHIGPYRTLRELGRGGMGTVFLAVRDDDEYRKQVAIKVIKRGMDTDEIVRRFRRERQILAGLEHPNIAALLDGGTTEDGLPYFVLEFVVGLPIDRFCAQHRLTIRQRLELFCTVCSAVQFAHQNLVIHRDLKPSNILVTADGTPKLLDFGIAKLLAPESPFTALPTTASMVRLMTPEYASPEQVRGEAITTASDVYSLGVLLYELLTGHRPYELHNRTPAEVSRVILERDPAPPSTVIDRTPDPATLRPPDDGTLRRRRRRLRGDVDNIVLMALRKEPRRRYVSVDQLARDIERHLAGRPVMARKDTLSYRLSKFVRRNKAASLVVLLVFLFAIAMTQQRFVIARERDRAQVERAKAERIRDFLIGVFEISDPERARGATITAREILDRGARSAREGGLAEEPEIRAQLLDTVGAIYYRFGFYDPAEELLQDAFALRSETLEPTHPDLAESLFLLAEVHIARGDPKQAEPLHRRALELRRAAFGEHHRAVAISLNAVGTLLLQLGRAEEGEELLRDALSMLRSLPEEHPGDIADSLNNLAGCLAERGEYQEAVNALQQALELNRSALGEGHPDIATGHTNVGVVLYQLGRYDEALPELTQGLEQHRRVLGPDHPNVTLTLSVLGSVYRQLGQLDRAAATLHETLEAQRTGLGEDHPDTATTERSLAGVLKELRDFDGAEALYRRSLETQRQRLGPRDPAVASTMNNLAMLLLERDAPGDADEAERLLRDTLTLRLEIRGEDHPEVATSYNNLAVLLAERGDLDGAQKLYEQALDLRRRLLPADHPALAYSLTGLGVTLLDLELAPEAEPLLREAVELRRRGLPAGHWRTAKSEALLGQSLLALGRTADGLRYLEPAYDRLLDTKGTAYPDTRRAAVALEATRPVPGER